MENTWMPKVAGILDIVAGSLGILISLLLVLWFAFFSFMMSSGPGGSHDFPAGIMIAVFAVWGIIIFAAGILAIIGGISALRKQNWGLALAGSIAAFFGSSPLGVAAIIFTALSRKEFL
jgi:hypothetical protein